MVSHTAETCRDLGHVQLGYATLVNTAETAWQQGIDLYGEEQDRLIAGAEMLLCPLALAFVSDTLRDPYYAVT